MKCSRLHMTLFVSVAILLSGILASCEHRELTDMGNTHYVRVYIDEHILNITEGIYEEKFDNPKLELPTVMKAALYDLKTGTLVADKFLQNVGRDKRGYYVDGYIIAPPGGYKFLVYSFETEKTRFMNESEYSLVEAYTNPVSKMHSTNYGSKNIIDSLGNVYYEPDHTWGASSDFVNISMQDAIDTIFNKDGDFFEAEPVVKSYYIQVRVKGAEHIKASSAVLSGLVGSVRMHDRQMVEDNPVNVYFDLKMGPTIKVEVDSEKGDGQKELTEMATIYTTFNTFGKHPEIGSIFQVTFEFHKAEDRVQRETIDITPQFYSEDGLKRQWLLIDREFIITPPDIEGSGGFTPGVGEWKDQQADVNL